MNESNLSLPSIDHSKLTAYEAQLASELRRVSQRALQQWQRDADSAFEQALAIAVEQASAALYEELSASLSGAVSGTASGGFSQARLSSAITDLVSRQVSQLLGRTRTTTATRETDRSRQTEDEFRRSRSQIQADSARSAAAGQRNL